MDDEPALLDVGKKFLEHSGAIAVETALSGREALVRLDEQPFDAVVADYQMPEMDGIGLLKEIRRRFGLLPFLLFTGRGREEVVMEALNHGADGYVQKGGDPRSQFVELEHRIVQAVERRRTVLALQDSEERYRALFDGASDPIVIFEGDRFSNCNSKTLDIFHCTREFLIGKKPWDISCPVQPDGAPAQASAVKKMSAAYAGQPQFFEWRIAGPSGKRYDVEVSASRLNVKGSPCLQAIVRDVTLRKRTQAALVAANRKMHLLASITRHDILNQLTVLHGYLALAKEQITDPVILGYMDQQEKAIGFIRRQIAFTQDYGGLGVRAPEYLDLRDCVDRAAASLTPDLTLHTEVDGVEVYADLMLEKVFYNIFENTVRYAGPTPEVRVDCSRRGGGLLVVIEDNGPGIPSGEKEKIFLRGFGRNTGLGLFFVREVLATTGITIREAGELRKGVRFEMLVPKGGWRVRGASAADGV